MRLSFSSRLLLLAATLPAAAPLRGQMHKVEAPKKVTRAVGVYEWTGDLAKPTAARLIPVSVFIDAQMQDGGTYYARPVPLALENGNIYSYTSFILILNKNLKLINVSIFIYFNWNN